MGNTVVFEELDKLPEKLRERVLGYAARRMGEIESMLQEAKASDLARYEEMVETLGHKPGIVANLPESLTFTGKTAVRMAELVMLAGNPNVYDNFNRKVEHLGLSKAMKILVQDERLSTLYNELNAHYNNAIPPSLIDEAIQCAAHIQEKTPQEFKRLAELKILPVSLAVVGETVEEAGKAAGTFLEHFKRPGPLAFGAVSCVAIGACCHAMLTPHQQAAFTGR